MPMSSRPISKSPAAGRRISPLSVCCRLPVLALLLVSGIAGGQELAAVSGAEASGGTTGFFLGSSLAPDPAPSPQRSGVSAEAPERDPVGGFTVGILAGVQLRGSGSGQFGLSLAWFNRSTSNVGLEFEGAVTRGPDGQVYHGLMSVILQSGSRAARMVPYLAVGGGVFHAREQLRDTVADALPDFGIDPVEGTETGGLFAFGFGVRYYLSEKLSFRGDYREMRAITTADGGIFDRIHSMRRIGGFLMIQF